MDHAHGHAYSLSLSPSTSSTDFSSQPSTQRRRPFSTPAPPSPFTPPPPSDAPASAHQRRLQLRNLGFRAPQLSAQKLGARFSRLINGSEEPRTAPAREKISENAAPHRESLHNTRSEYHLKSSLGILNEISNSTRSLNSRKRATIPIYEDDPERPLLQVSSPVTPTTQYHDASSTYQSPVGFHYFQEEPATMRLRQVSGNERRHSPSFSSPLSSTGHGKNTRARTRKPSFEAAEYIEHIEKQLEQVKQAMHSPKSGKPLPEKMKALKSENGQLKKAIAELEGSFEARVKNSVEHMTASEGELRRKIKAIEDDIRAKDTRIEELEYYYDQSRLDQATLENLKSTIDRLEVEKLALEDTNRILEKRTEVLTELLAFSPTKSQHGLELASPLRRNPRPRSMLMRFPSSPNTAHKSRPYSIVASPVLSPEGYFSSRSGLDLELDHPCNHAEDPDSGLGESCSIKSPMASSSRRSTLQSQESISPSNWGLPLPASPGDGNSTIRQPYKRKPRRFMTGSTQLKPLLLPSMAAESAGVTSPRSPDHLQISEESSDFYQPIFLHQLEGSQKAARREISDQSLDPTISFLSNPFEDVSHTDHEFTPIDLTSSPPLAARNDCSSPPGIVSLADEVDITAFLHHRIPQDAEIDTGVEEDVTVLAPTLGYQHWEHQHSEYQAANLSQTMDPEEPLTAIISYSSPSGKGAALHSPKSRKRRRLSSIPVSPLTSPTPASNFRPPDPDAEIIRPCYNPVLNPVSLAARAAHKNFQSPPTSPQRLSRSTSPLEILQRRSVSSSPLATVTIRSIYGTLSRYTTYIREFKRDPLALARRVIATAWCNNWKRLGKLTWWVLGIFLTGSKRDQADQAGWDWDLYDGEAVADSMCRREGLASEGQERRLSQANKVSPDRHVRFDEHHEGYRTKGSKASAKPAFKCGKQKRAGFGKSLYLWGKFSVAIMLAVGGAVWNGPGEMLRDCDSHPRSPKRASNDTRSLPSDEFQSRKGYNSSKSPIAHSSTPSRIFTFGSPSRDIGWDAYDDYGGLKPSRWSEGETGLVPEVYLRAMTSPVRVGIGDTHSVHG